MTDLVLGQVVDARFRVDRRVGAGGFGDVYLAWHLAFERPVALKVLRIPPTVTGDARRELIDVFLREGRTLTRLRHPGIVSALDLGTVVIADCPVPYIAMEWCDGRSLAADLAERAGAPLSVDDAYAILAPAVDAIGHAHGLGIVHRDIKPSNLMLDRGAEGVPSVRVIDFGISKWVDPRDVAGTGRTRTASPSSPFTLAYAAPEQLAGARTGPWTDVHALGLLFVEMVTGRAPYGDGDSGLGGVDPKRPTPAAFGIEVGAFEKVLQKALALRPNARHADARELLRDLDAAFRDRQRAASDSTLPLALPAQVARGRQPDSSTMPSSSVAPRSFGLDPGTLVGGRYRVLGTIGRGGMGVVLEVSHEPLGTPFALKVPTRVLDEATVARFLREARATARLKSEYVARVTDFGTLDDGRPYLVMERLDGAPLDVFLDGDPSVEEIVDAMAQACAGLAEAHAAGIVHRDLKPSNLFRARRPDGSFCTKVLDFGVSKLGVTGELAADELTHTDQVLGTPLYMSPEQLRGSKTVNASSDVWAMGVVLYEALTGEVPFRAESATATTALILEQAPRPLRELAPDVAEALAELVEECLDKQPNARVRSAAELARRLAPFGTAEAALASDRARGVMTSKEAPGIRPADATATLALATTVAASGARAAASGDSTATSIARTLDGARPASAAAATPPNRRALVLAMVGLGAAGLSALVLSGGARVSGVPAGSGAAPLASSLSRPPAFAPVAPKTAAAEASLSPPASSDAPASSSPSATATTTATATPSGPARAVVRRDRRVPLLAPASSGTSSAPSARPPPSDPSPGDPSLH